MLDVKDIIAVNQLAASDPESNVWVNASAGSGKTKVLIDRILRLLLKGIEPNTILCITFTQAAALEMQERLQHHLERWVIMSEEDLIQTLNDLEPSLKLTPDIIFNARKLFNYVLDAPVRIGTIHSFAQQILISGVDESQMSFGMRLMDELSTKNLVRKALDQIVEAKHHKDLLNPISKLFSHSKFTQIIQKILDEQAFFRFLLIEGASAFKKRLEDYLGNPRLEVAIMKDISESLKKLTFKPLLESSLGSESDRKLLHELDNAAISCDFKRLVSSLLTEKGTPKKRLLSKKITESYPDETNQIYAFAQDVCRWDQELKKSKMVESTLAVLKLAEVFLNSYTALKQEKGLLDYDDLIFKAIILLEDPETAYHVLYKLDTVIHHVLIDEAQDTNVYQWKLINYIIGNFFQHEQDKTIFVVGDHKQSIFGFQGTDPDIFDRIKHYYHHQPSLKAWKDVSLDVSFRSLQAILDFVDAIFENNYLIENYVSHIAFRGEGGNAVVHPLIVESDKSDEDIYEKLAAQVTDQIEKFIGTEMVIQGKRRYILPSDILVLIRKRGEHLEKLQQALLLRKIPFSSPTRQTMYEDELVRFILLALNLIMQPYDNAAVMHLLLNPLLNIKEEGIKLGLARSEEGGHFKDILGNIHIFAPLQKDIKKDISLEDMYLRVCVWAIQHLPVNNHNITNAFIVLDFLREWVWGADITLTHSELLYYVQSLPIGQANRVEENALRILTVHGAKGLQAPIVMLIDTTQLPTMRNVWVNDDLQNIFLCVQNRSLEPFQYQDLKSIQKANERKEYYRLLYVALTRAESELHVFGAAHTKVSEETWYSLCASFLEKKS